MKNRDRPSLSNSTPQNYTARSITPRTPSGPIVYRDSVRGFRKISEDEKC